MTIGENTLCVGGSRPDLITNITIVGLDSYTVCKVFGHLFSNSTLSGILPSTCSAFTHILLLLVPFLKLLLHQIHDSCAFHMLYSRVAPTSPAFKNNEVAQRSESIWSKDLKKKSVRY